VEYWNSIESTLDKSLNNYQKLFVIRFLKDSSIYYYDAFLEALKANDQKELFPNTGGFISQEYNKFLYKINRVYVNPNMTLSLDKGLIDYEILDALIQWDEVFRSHENPYIGLRRKVYDNEYLRKNISQALFEENIIFFNKYFKRAHFEQYIFNIFNWSHLPNMKQNKLNSPFKKIWFYYYFRPFKAFKFSSDFYTIGQIKYLFSLSREGWDFSSKDWIYGSNLKWDVPDELYKGENNRNYYLENFQKIKVD
jgi:hypothetical protein